MKKQLEIISASSLNLLIPMLEKEELNLRGKIYIKSREWETPYIKIPRKVEEFHKEMHNLISKFGKSIDANLAVITYTHTHYPNNSANHDVIFYKEK